MMRKHKRSTGEFNYKLNPREISTDVRPHSGTDVALQQEDQEFNPQWQQMIFC